jgi:hypothetical protein
MGGGRQGGSWRGEKKRTNAGKKQDFHWILLS